jgi:hypothetical protein
MKRSVTSLVYRALEIAVTVITYVVLAVIVFSAVRWLVS